MFLNLLNQDRLRQFNYMDGALRSNLDVIDMHIPDVDSDDDEDADIYMSNAAARDTDCESLQQDEDRDDIVIEVAGGVDQERFDDDAGFIDKVLEGVDEKEFEAEHQQHCRKEHCDICQDLQYQYLQIATDKQSDNRRCIQLRAITQRTFAEFLHLEHILATHENQRRAHAAHHDDAIDDGKNSVRTKMFYCPYQMDHLLHGFVRHLLTRDEPESYLALQQQQFQSIKRHNFRHIHVHHEREQDLVVLHRIVPSVVMQLLHAYYSSPNVKWRARLREGGLHWSDHHCILQHPHCKLERYNADQNEWLPTDATAYGQLTLLYDDVKGFTRLIMVDCHGRLSALQIVEGNALQIQLTNDVTHDSIKQRTSVVYSGFDYTLCMRRNDDDDDDVIQRQVPMFGSLQKFRVTFAGSNHEYYARQFVKSYNHVLESELQVELKMLRKTDLFQQTISHGQTQQADLERLHEYVTRLQDNDDVEVQVENARLVRKLLSKENEPPIQQIIECGVIQRLLYLMQFSTSSVLKFECAWSLTNIASGTQAHTDALIHKFHALPALLHAFKKTEHMVEIKEQCLWALANIAGDSVQCRDLVLQHGILRHIVALIRPYRMLMFKTRNVPKNMDVDDEVKTAADVDADSDDDAKMTDRISIDNDDEEDALSLCRRQRQFMRNLVWTLSNLNRNKPLPSYAHMTLSLHAIHVLLKDEYCHRDMELLQDCCWTLSYMTDYDGDDVRIRHDLPLVMIECGVVDVLVRILSDAAGTHYNAHVKHPALRTIGNLATGTDRVTTLMLHRHGFMHAINALLTVDSNHGNTSSSSSTIRRETLWLISNITAGPPTQIEWIVAYPGLLRRITHMLLVDGVDDDSVLKEGIWVLSNATSGGSAPQIAAIVEADGIRAFVKYMASCVQRGYYGRVLAICVDAVENILMMGLQQAFNATAHPLQAVLGQNGVTNPYTVQVIAAGVLPVFQSLIMNEAVSEFMKGQIQNLMEAHLPHIPFPMPVAAGN